jgi:hypothetical protein
MYIVSECLTCVVVTFTLGAFLFAFSVVLLTIKQQIESRRDTLREFQKAEAPFRAQPAAVVNMEGGNPWDQRLKWK